MESGQTPKLKFLKTPEAMSEFVELCFFVKGRKFVEVK